MKKIIFLLAMFFTISAIAQTSTTTSPKIPSQQGNAGKYLKTNGSKLSWADVTAGLTASLTPNYIPYAVSSTSLANSSILYTGAGNLSLGMAGKAVSTTGTFPIYAGYGNSFETGYIGANGDIALTGSLRLGATGYTTLSNNGSNGINYYAYSGHNFSSSLDGATSGNNNITYSTTVGSLRHGFYGQGSASVIFDFYSGGVRNSQIEESNGYLVNKAKNRWSVKNYNSNTSNLWVDMETGYVGVGSDYFAPSYQFQVNGKAYVHDQLIVGNNSQFRFFDGSMVDKSRMYFHNPTNRFYHYSEGGYSLFSGYGERQYFETSYANFDVFVNRANYTVRTQNSGGEDFTFTLNNTKKCINLSSVPTSSVGLTTGDIYSDAGTLKIVP